MGAFFRQCESASRRKLFELRVAFVDQVTAAVASLAVEAQLVGVSFGVCSAAPTLNACQTKTLAQVFFSDFSAELESYFSWDLIHYEPAA